MPPVAPSQTSGPVTAVPCPFCKQSNDMSPHAEEEQELDTGNEFGCDHCHKRMQVVGLHQVTMVTVRPSPRQPAAPAQKPGGVLGKLLGR